MEQYDILTLSNNKDYVISQILNYNDHDYLLLIEVDKNENILNEKLILEKINNNGKICLGNIENRTTYECVRELFAKKLLEDLK